MFWFRRQLKTCIFMRPFVSIKSQKFFSLACLRKLFGMSLLRSFTLFICWDFPDVLYSCIIQLCFFISVFHSSSLCLNISKLWEVISVSTWFMVVAFARCLFSLLVVQTIILNVWCCEIFFSPCTWCFIRLHHFYDSHWYGARFTLIWTHIPILINNDHLLIFQLSYILVYQF